MSNATNTVPPSIRLNGQDFIMLPLNWKQLKAHKADIILINKLDPSKGMFSDEEADAILNVVHASIQRSRNDVAKEFVEEHLDLGNVGEILSLVFASGTKNNGVDSSGEVTAATSQT